VQGAPEPCQPFPYVVFLYRAITEQQAALDRTACVVNAQGVNSDPELARFGNQARRTPGRRLLENAQSLLRASPGRPSMVARATHASHPRDGDH